MMHCIRTKVNKTFWSGHGPKNQWIAAFAATVRVTSLCVDELHELKIGSLEHWKYIATHVVLYYASLLSRHDGSRV